jgi:hypothetical protein
VHSDTNSSTTNSSLCCQGKDWMEGIQMDRNKRVYLFCGSFLFSVFFHAAIFANQVMAGDYFWSDYRKPFTGNMEICHNKDRTLAVDIPSEFLKNNDKVSLFVEIESNSYPSSNKKTDRSFEGFTAYLKVNNSVFGSYRLNSHKKKPVKQSKFITIKRKYLKSGGNVFKFSFQYDKGWKCLGKCCSYKVSKLYFRDAPAILHTLSISSSPSNANVYVDKHLKGVTPINVDVEEGQHGVEIRKNGYQVLGKTVWIYYDESYSFNLEKE